MISGCFFQRKGKTLFKGWEGDKLLKEVKGNMPLKGKKEIIPFKVRNDRTI